MDPDDADALNHAIRLLSLRHRARTGALLAPLDLHPGQEVLLLALARGGPMIQSQLSEALGCEPPSVTLMARKLETAGHIRREPARDDRRATVVTLTDAGRELVGRLEQVWLNLAEETVDGLPDATVEMLPALLRAMAANVDTKRSPS
jgi:DNA-binding MarR family transcriptional regulator